MGCLYRLYSWKKERRRLGAIDIEQFELKSSLAFAEDASLTSQEDITQPKKSGLT